MPGAVLSVIGGVLLVSGSAEALVRGGTRLALALRVSSLLVGLTVVAYGTSTPELIVSLLAAMRGASDIAVGNVLGSNIVNIGLIAGAAALLRPLRLDRATTRTDIPIALAVSSALVLLALDGSLSRRDGVLMLLGAVAHGAWCIARAYRESQEPSELPPISGSRRRDVLLVLGGLAGLALGAHLLVEGAVLIATDLGVSQLVIGVTVVAVGTSLPELAASLVAARRGHPGLSIGNVVGSNILNILVVIGLSATIHPIAVRREALVWDAAPMLALTVALYAFARTGTRLSRREGSALLLLFVAYMAVSVLRQRLGWV